MKPYPLLLAVLAAAPAGEAVRTADPAKAATGKLLLFETERTLEGDIERVGDQYRVRRTTGETWVPAQGVLCLCAGPEEGYVFLRDRANLGDPDERMRLAQWCRQRGLRKQALEEVRAAAELRPGHA